MHAVADYDRPWRHIAADLRAKIVGGRWQPGDRLPTIPQLQQQYGVARNTVRNAINHLVDEGLLYTRTGSGIYVTARADTDHRS
jgi:DNA-binding GntR family transcriptional regulator